MISVCVCDECVCDECVCVCRGSGTRGEEHSVCVCVISVCVCVMSVCVMSVCLCDECVCLQRFREVKSTACGESEAPPCPVVYHR